MGWAVACTEAILRAVERIHEAPLTPGGWAPALDAITATVGGDRTFIIDQDLSTGRIESVASVEVSSEQLAALKMAAGTGTLPDWAPNLQPGKVAASSAMISDRDFARSTFYNEIIRPAGDFYGLTASLVRDSERSVYLAVGRRLGRADYDDEDRSCLQLLLPHVATAMRVGWRLISAEGRADSLDVALEYLETGVVVTDADSVILFANVAADRLLSANRGISTDRDGLCGSNPTETSMLRRLVRACAGRAAESGSRQNGILLGDQMGSTPLRVIVAPFAPGSWASEALCGREAALVLISDPACSLHERKEHLRRSYGLTPMETLVALEIARAQGRATAARRLGIAEATLKTHLIHIFEKTGVSRQAELVRLLLQQTEARS